MWASSFIITLIILSIVTIPIQSEPAADVTTTKCGDLDECINSADLSNIAVECTAKTSCKNSTITTPKPKSGHVKCSGTESCSKTDITTLGKKDTLCSGWKSCFAAKSISTRHLTCNGASSCNAFAGAGYTITTTGNVVCGGDYACQRQEPMNSGKSITCSGYNSCVLNTLNAVANIDCSGVRGCVFSTLTAGGTVTCSGQQSCHNAEITAASGVLLTGHEAAFKTTIKDTPYINVLGATALDKGCTIDSGSVSHMTVRMEAPSDIMNDAFIICRSGAECSLICGSSGCTNIIYQCESGATCNIEPAECATNPGAILDGITCPTMTNAALSALDMLQDEDDGDNLYLFHKEAKGEEGELTDYDTSCTMERECESQEFVAAEGTLYCDGGASCQGATIRDRKSVCNGDRSCALVDITNAAGPYCYGAYSCANAINMFSSDRIYCFGEGSCQRSSMHSSTMIECRGGTSCMNSAIVMPEGYYTACYGDQSCLGATINNGDTASVLCRGQSSCEGGELTTSYVGKDFGEYYAVQCYGEYSCKDSVITTTGQYSKVHIAGSHGGEGATINIRGVEVVVTGYRGLKFATIDSEDSPDLVLTLKARQAMFRGTFICRRGSICKVKCNGDSCQALDYLCENGATCNVVPSGCASGKPRVGNYNCPNIQSVVANYDMTEILEQKRMEREQEEQEEEEEEEEELLLFGGELLLSSSSLNNGNQVFLFGMIGILGSIGMILCYYKWCKKGGKQYISLL